METLRKFNPANLELTPKPKPKKGSRKISPAPRHRRPPSKPNTEVVADSPPSPPSPVLAEATSTTLASTDVIQELSWCLYGEDLGTELESMGDVISSITGCSLVPEVASDTSLVRREYRKMLWAINLMAKAFEIQRKRSDWMVRAVRMNEYDSLRLREHCVQLATEVNNMRSNITLSTQVAVRTIVEMRADDFYAECEEDGDGYEKYVDISKLCNTALTSLGVLLETTKSLKQRSAELQKKRRALMAKPKVSTARENCAVQLRTLSMKDLESLRRAAKACKPTCRV